MRYIKTINIILICLLGLILLLLFSSGREDINKGKITTNIIEMKEEILSQKDRYLTVGRENCEFETIKEALKAVDSDRSTIYILDEVHTENSIVVEDKVTIRGFGEKNTIVQGASDAVLAEDRVFKVEKNGELTIEDLTVRHGKVNKHPRAGAGIYNEGKLIIEKCIIRDNIGTYGVGIFSYSYLEIIDSKIVGNRSVRRPLDEDRRALGCAGSGGGIKVQSGEAKIINSIIADNDSIRSGGGIKISCPAKADIINSIIAQNKSQYFGGGISAHGEVTLTHCTIINNDSSNGGGVSVAGKVEIIGNIIAENKYGDFRVITNSTAFSPEVRKNEFNFIGDGKFTGFLSGDAQIEKIVGEDGEIITYALDKKSDAVDAIPEEMSANEEDHRGISRDDGRNDIGAYELNEDNLFKKEYILLLIGVLALLMVINCYSYIKKGSTMT